MEAQNLLAPDFENMKNIKEFNLKYNDKIYLLTISNISETINFSIVNSYNEEYSESYSLEKLIYINKIFSMFDSLEKVRNSIEEIIKAKKYLLEINDKNIIITLKISLFEKIIEVSLNLNKKKINQNNLNDLMIKQIKELKNEINNLKNKHKEDIDKLIIEIK